MTPETRTFFLSGVNVVGQDTLYDCDCTLTDQRLMIKAQKGKVRQIPLRDIVSLEPYRKALIISAPGLADTYLVFRNKEQLAEVLGWIQHAITN